MMALKIIRSQKMLTRLAPWHKIAPVKSTSMCREVGTVNRQVKCLKMAETITIHALFGKAVLQDIAIDILPISPYQPRENVKHMVADGISFRKIRRYLSRWAAWWHETACEYGIGLFQLSIIKSYGLLLGSEIAKAA